MPTEQAEKKVGWRPAEFMRATGIKSRQTLDNIIARGEIKKVKVGAMAIIVTSPAEFLHRKAREQFPKAPRLDENGNPLPKRPRGRPKGSKNKLGHHAGGRHKAATASPATAPVPLAAAPE